MVKSLIKILIFSLLIKLFYFAFAIIIANTKQNDLKVDFDFYISTLKKNDAYWYDKIARFGYSEINNKRDLGYHDGADFKQSEWAFFPLYPYLVRSIAKLTSSNTNAGFLVLSHLASVLCFMMFLLLLMKYKNEDESLYITYLLMIFPFHFYFSMFYTEGLFFLSLIGGFYALLKKNYILFILASTPLVLIRPNGIVMLIPMYLFMLEQTEVLSKKSFELNSIFSMANILRSLVFIPSVIAFLVYGAYQYSMTNDFFAFSTAQQGWYREFMFPLLALFRHGDLATQFNSVYTIVFIILAIFSWRKLPLSLNILIWFSLLLPLTSGSVLSMQRFVSVIFPFTIIIGSWLYQKKASMLFLVLLFCIQLFSYYFWLIEHPISY